MPQARQSKRSGLRMQTLTAEDLSIRGSEYGGTSGAMPPLVGSNFNVQLNLKERDLNVATQRSRSRGLFKQA